MRFVLPVTALMSIFSILPVSADPREDAIFAKSMFATCGKRTFTTEEQSRLADLRDNSRPNSDGQFFSGRALMCQKIYVERTQKEDDAAHFKDRFAAGLANSPECKAQIDAVTALFEQLKARDQLKEALELAQAGENAEACRAVGKLRAELDQSRQGLLTCYKSIPAEADANLLVVKKFALEKAQALFVAGQTIIGPQIEQSLGCQ